MSRKKNWTMSPKALPFVAERFKILAEPLRLRILQTLEAGELSVNEIAETVEASQPNVSKHLKILTDAGLLSRRQEGNVAFYAIADDSVFVLCDAVCSSLKARFVTKSAIFS